MDKKRLHYLLEKQLSNTISDGEQQELRQLLESVDRDLVLEVMAGHIAQEEKNPRHVDDATLEASFNNVIDSDKAYDNGPENDYAAPAHRVHFLRKAWFRYAAAVLFLVATGAYLWFHHNEQQTLADSGKQLSQDINPGREGAILTLADGSQIVLDSMHDGVIAEESGSKILLQNGKMVYDAHAENGQEAFNTLTTPKGRQYQLILPDGTRIWLNAASSIRYPTAFTQDSRRVEVKGEAYFEVTKDKMKPFIVNVNQEAEIEVLGTSFNIKAYENENSVQATLIEGSVRVRNLSKHLRASSNRQLTLKPGQQAVVTIVGDKIGSSGDERFPTVSLVKDPNIDKITAWKMGIFNFDGSTLVEVMKELERWYDIEVVYEGAPADMRFVGKLQKNLTLNDLLDVLIKSDVKFELDGRKLILKNE